MAEEVSEAESEAVGRVIREDAQAAAMEYTPAAVIARQRQIIVLLNGVRALNIALLCLFVVFGFGFAFLFDALAETRRVGRIEQREQQIAFCDLYEYIDEEPPKNLGCE